MDAKTWKKGDDVSIVERERLILLSVVERITPSGMVAVRDYGGLFRVDGWERGSSGLFARKIVPPTDAHREEVKRADLWCRFDSLLHKRELRPRVPTADLERFVGLLAGEVKP